MRQFFVICLMASALCMNAQSGVDARIKQIRQAYSARLSMMENQPYDDMKVEQMTLSYNRMFPGTGLAQFNDTYYWTDDENEDYMLKPILYFVTSRYTMNSGIYCYSREYLYDAETEEPMFLLITAQLGDDPSTRMEFRFYFDKGRLIKQIPEKIVQSEDSILTLDFAVDENGRGEEQYLIQGFENIKELFHDIVPTYAW